MKRTLPTIDQEYSLSDHDVLISKTDTQSHITYANPSFIRVSGYDYDELLGRPHNLVRHPDMPPEVFEDMWKTLLAGSPWQGYVKNRRKDGTYYWVQANAVPIKQGNQLVGLASIRVKADPQVIREMEQIYRKMRERPGSYVVKQGRLYAANGLGRFFSVNRHSITSRLVLSGVISGALAASIVSGAYLLSDTSRDALNNIGQSHVSMMGDLHDLTRQISQTQQRVNLSVYDSDAHINKALPDVKKEVNGILDDWKKIKKAHFSDAESKQLNKIDRLMHEVVGKGMLDTMNSSAADSDEALEKDARLFKASVDELSSLLSSEIKNTQQMAITTANDSLGEQERRLNYIILLGILLILLTAISFYRIIASIRRPLEKAHMFSLQVAAGNLESEAPSSEKNEIGKVINNMSLMRKSLDVLVTEISQSISSVVPSIDSIVGNNDAMAGRIEQQAAAVQETAASMEEITSVIRNSADNASSASSFSIANMAKIGEAEAIIEDMKVAMTDIREQSKSMEDMIKVIDGIAFQTNILALNASVEAARAGEQGRGFSVVAQEVRSLASRSAEAAKAIQTSIESAIKSVEKGVGYSTKTADVMLEISTSSSQVNDLMSEISASAREQEHGVSQIGLAINEIDRATQESSNAMSKYTESTITLKTETEQLENSANAFKIGAVTTKSSPRRLSQTNPTASRQKADQTYQKPARAQASKNDDWEEF